jgi:hypothetical protein
MKNSMTTLTAAVEHNCRSSEAAGRALAKWGAEISDALNDFASRQVLKAMMRESPASGQE